MARQLARAIHGVALIGAAIGIAQCDRSGTAVTPASDPEILQPAEEGAMPSPRPLLGRSDLLAAVAAAASDTAGGVVRRGPSGLDGRQFRLRIAFGCQGENAPPPGINAPRDGVPRRSRPADKANLRLSLSPADWSDGDPSGPAPLGFDSMEGVWITRPWMMGEGCPTSGLPVPDPGVARPGPRVGLAMLRAEGASRLGRAGSGDFSYLVRGQTDAPAPDPANGYRLVIEGRLMAWGDGRVIRCQVIRADEPPSCAIGASVDKIAFEDAAGAGLSDWRLN